MQQSDCLFFFPFFICPMNLLICILFTTKSIGSQKIIVYSLLVLLVNELSPFPSGPPLLMLLLLLLLLLLHRNQKNRTQLLAMVPHGLILHFDHYYYTQLHCDRVKCSLPQPPRCTTTCENREKMTKMIECSFWVLSESLWEYSTWFASCYWLDIGPGAYSSSFPCFKGFQVQWQKPIFVHLHEFMSIYANLL